MKLFAQIRKVDEDKRLIFGRAAEEVVDKSDEIMDYASSKPHFVKWSEDIAKDTDGKSLGNVRAMHGKVAAGKLTAIDFDDAAKTIDVCAKVVDDGEWKKVLEGVYTGFSIGGSYVGEKKVEKADGRDVSRYTARPSELSLVDRPCIPTARFFEVQKADGSLAKVQFQSPAEVVEDVTVTGTADEIAMLGKLMNEHGLTLAELVEKAVPAFIQDKIDAKKKKAKDAKDTKKAETGDLQKLDAGALRKGMYGCSSFAQIIASLQSLQSSAAYEAYSEGDDSGIAEKIGACIAMCGSVLKDMIDEELAEVTESSGTPDPMVMEMAAKCGALAKYEGDPLATLMKAGARNSSADQQRIQAMHDHSSALGANCAAADDAEKLAKAAKAAELAKVESSAFEKLVADAVAPLSKALSEAQAEIKKLNAQPAPARISLRAVAKSEDVIPGTEIIKAEPAPITDARGVAHEAASLIKSLHQAGGAPLRK